MVRMQYNKKVEESSDKQRLECGLYKYKEVPEKEREYYSYLETLNELSPIVPMPLPDSTYLLEFEKYWEGVTTKSYPQAPK